MSLSVLTVLAATTLLARTQNTDYYDYYQDAYFTGGKLQGGGYVSKISASMREMLACVTSARFFPLLFLIVLLLSISIDSLLFFVQDLDTYYEYNYEYDYVPVEAENEDCE